jgi:hypothetical protein
MLHLIKTFSHDVDRYVQGGRAAERLIHQNKEAYKVFKDAIRSTAPNFQPYLTAVEDESDIESSKESDDDDEMESEDDDEMESKDDDEISNGNSEPFYLADMRKHIEEFVCDWEPYLYLGSY